MNKENMPNLYLLLKQRIDELTVKLTDLLQRHEAYKIKVEHDKEYRNKQPFSPYRDNLTNINSVLVINTKFYEMLYSKK